MTLPTTPRVLCVVATVALLGSGHAARGETNDAVRYIARANDSFAMIAAEFYGDRTKTAFLIAENKITRPRPLRQYERLRVPVIREITTAPGDTFQSLAQTQLGDAGRGGFLAEANDMTADASLPAGIAIRIPFMVTHTADNKESLVSVSSTYFGDSKHADVLKRFNNIDKPALDKGESIKVPSFGIVMHPWRINKPDAAAKQRRADRARFVKQAAIALPSARFAWRTGDFDKVRAELETIDPAYLDLDQAVDVDVLLGSALVSFDKTNQALDVFKRLLERKPGHVLRKLDHSPKVLAVWTQADGKVE